MKTNIPSHPGPLLRSLLLSIIKPALACFMAVLGLFWSAVCPAATITVTNGNDTGAGSLRQAILSSASGGTINFAAGISTIDLTSGELLIGTNLTIIGPGPNLLAVRRTSGNNFRIFKIPNTVAATISGLTISGGKGFNFQDGNGGGILNSGSLTISNCTISGNYATDQGKPYSGGGGSTGWTGGVGGGIHNFGGLTISNSTVSGNTADLDGGGLLNDGSMTIINSTISGNTTNGFGGGAGGGIYNGATLIITNSTVTGNSTYAGGSGGGIYGSFTARATIIALNTAGSPDVAGTITSQGFNLIGNNSGATITPAQSSDKIGTSSSPLDPKLGPLQNNGGPTFTCALLSGSPAIDAGDDSVLGSPMNLTTDQRGTGFPRKLGAHVDMGAVEYIVTPVITTSASPTAGGSTSGGGTFSSGASVTVVATQGPGYGFVNWTEGGIQVSGSASYNFTASADRTLVANFVLTATNANLASLAPSAGTLSPAFASSTTSYTDSVAKSALTFKVTPTVAQSGATVKVNGTAVTSGSASTSIVLTSGVNPVIDVVVTAPDGTTTKTYQVTVTRVSVISPRDWSGDAKPDLLFQNAAGQLYQWFLDGTGSALNFSTGAGLKGSGYFYTGGLSDWRVVGIGDVNGDGIPDLVFQNGVGQIYAWFLDGTGTQANFSTGAGLKGFRYLYTGGRGDWRVMGIGDVNGDGNPDLVFQNGAGQVYAWFLDGTGNAPDFSTGAGLRGSGYLYTGGLGDWRVVGIADVNGDGNPDLVFQNGVGQLYAWFLNGSGTALNFGTGAGLNGYGYLYTGGLGDWRVAGIMDVNGDNIPDLVFQNNAGQLYAWFLNGTGTAINFGTGVGLAGSVFLYTGGLGDWRVR